MKTKRGEMKSSDMIPSAYFAMDKYDAGEAIGSIVKYMADKASKAFCFCKCGIGPCIMKQVGREECKDLREFKRKMEE